ncbi:MAG: bifunctional diaminohydroxyphosphoribosylaminopyrimidine deaminase/5-amino-6-(5-phosphoribosylamino)uracil reductase RibD [Phycisphaerales bacterium]
MSGDEHKRYLDMAARAAWRAVGDVEPNPLVGAVLVRDGRVLAIGHHKRFGGLHAEREAIARCRELGEDPRGATLYCTLEPCCHTGKQPPCTEAVIEAGIGRVVCARHDPAEVSGGGCAILEAAGIPCEVSDASANATRISDPFVHRVRTGRPWVIAKWAQTLDGKLDVRDEGRRWISGESARRRVHRLRARVDAIVTGIGTVLADDPLLNVRGVRRVRRTPVRVVLDSRGRMPADAAMLRDDGPEVVVLREGVRDWGVVLGKLGERGIASVLLEAGPGVLGSAFEGGFVDQAVVHVPAGDAGAAARAAEAFMPVLGGGTFTRVRMARVGGDFELIFWRAASNSR